MCSRTRATSCLDWFARGCSVRTHIGWSWTRSSPGATSRSRSVRTDVRAKHGAQIQGIGPVTASAIVAGVGEFTQFRNARQFGAWLGLVPSQNSSGGRTSLGGITKRGDDYLRTLLIQGVKAAVMTANKRTDPSAGGWCTQGARGLAEGRRRARKQERADSVDDDDSRHRNLT
jgi:transposase